MTELYAPRPNLPWVKAETKMPTGRLGAIGYIIRAYTSEQLERNSKSRLLATINHYALALEQLLLIEVNDKWKFNVEVYKNHSNLLPGLTSETNLLGHHLLQSWWAARCMPRRKYK